MQSSDKQIAKCITTEAYIRDQHFKSNPKNLEGVISFISLMQPTRESFQTVFKLIQEFRLFILPYCEPLYEKVNQLKDHKALVGPITQIANFVSKLNPQKFVELDFYYQFAEEDQSPQGILVSRTLEQICFVKDRRRIVEWIKIKGQYPEMKTLPEGVFQVIYQISQRNSLNKTNVFLRFYMDKMIQQLLTKFQVITIEDLRPKSILLQGPKPEFQPEKIPQSKPFQLSIQSNLLQATVSPNNDPNNQPNKEKLNEQKIFNLKNQTVWALNARDQIFYHQASNNTWKKINGSLVRLSVASDGRLWGVNCNMDIYTRPGVYGEWRQISGKLVDISAYENGEVWGINCQNQVYMRESVQKDWKHVPEGKFKKRDEPNVEWLNN